jgi:diguanylate cyclase (GGDEF)-like protein
MNALTKLTIPYKNLLGILLLSAIFIFSYSSENFINTSFYDFVLKQKASNKNHIVIIAIDDKSIQALGRWPWPREVHGRLLDVLPTTYSAIGFDILFVEPDLKNPQSDLNFSQAISHTHNVVLPLSPNFQHDTKRHEFHPLSIFQANTVTLGHNDFELDKDGVMRKIYLYAGWQQAKWPSFSLALAKIKQPDNFTPPTEFSIGNFWTRQTPINIAFNQEDTPIFSYVDILSGRVSPKKFHNKIILIGVTASGIGERFTVPTSISHQRFSGVEINAKIINSLLSNSTISTLSYAEQYFITAVIIILAVLCFYYFTTTRLLISLSALITITISIPVVSLLFYNIWIDPVLSISLLLFTLIYLFFVTVKHYKNELLEFNQKIYTDKATQLPNAEKINSIITELIFSAQVRKKPFPIIIINIGKFKDVNDLVGFKGGDNLLKLMTKRIKHFIDDKQVLARHTGTEFIVTGLSIYKEDEVKQMCSNIHLCLSKIFSIQNESFTLPISIGVSTYPYDGLSSDVLINCATSAMQRAKERFERGICFYHKNINQEILERHHFENDLAQALGNNEIEVHYQPQVNAQTGKIVGLEALARWLHPVKGYISPAEFIPIAESTGQIIEIGNWILKTACQQVKEWQTTYVIPLKLGVNVSAIQFSKETLVINFSNILKYTGFNAEYLELELTESCLIENVKDTQNKLYQLKKMNIKLSIDDFGTGYSSLSYLKKFPIDCIKIDRSFVKDINESIDANKIIQAIISMAHSLNMSIIAEGIELPHQQEFLQKNHCEILQGYLFSKPLPAKDFELLLKTYNKSDLSTSKIEVNKI